MDEMKLVDDKVLENADLYQRMDDTKALLEDKYIFRDYKDDEIKDAIPVTRNIAAWQATVMINKLIGLKWQTKVESSNKLAKSLISRLEKFSNDIQAQKDEFILREHGLTGGLDSWHAKKVVTRGPIGERIWLYYDKEGKLVIDCLPLDMRWVPYELNEWYCIRTWHTAAELRRQYGDKMAIADQSARIEKRVFWDKESERIFVSGQKVAERSNPYGILPLATAMTSSGFQFRDDGYLKHESESFDWLDRNLYKEANRSASIAQTLALYAFLSAWAQQTKGISRVADEPPRPQSVTKYAEGEVPVRVELGDLSAGYLKAFQDISQDIERGGVTDTEAGNNTGQNTALWITTQNAILAEKLLPFKDALASLRQLSFRLVIEQYTRLSKTGHKEVDLGVEGMRHRYSADQLGDPSTYRVEFIPLLQSKEQNIANVAIANAQRGLLPLRFILEDTLQMQDPDRILRELEMEKAKVLDPSIGLIEMALAFVEEAEDLEGVDVDIALLKSQEMTENAVLMRRQRRMASQQVSVERPAPKQLAAPQEEKPNLQGLIALTGDGGNGGSPRTRAEVRTVAK